MLPERGRGPPVNQVKTPFEGRFYILLLHDYYIQKGWKAEEFLSLDLESRLFYQASMLVALDERAKMFSLE